MARNFPTRQRVELSGSVNVQNQVYDKESRKNGYDAVLTENFVLYVHVAHRVEIREIYSHLTLSFGKNFVKVTLSLRNY